jgi:hypothetical protein
MMRASLVIGETQRGADAEILHLLNIVCEGFGAMIRPKFFEPKNSSASHLLSQLPLPWLARPL